MDWLVRQAKPMVVQPTPVQSRMVMTVSGSGATSVDTLPAGHGPGLPLWPQFLVTVYLLVAAGAALRVWIRVRRAELLIDQAEQVRDQAMQELVRSLCVEQRIGYPPPRLVESATAHVPFTAGWRAPVIVLPPAWREWDEFKLRAVLVHEMAHIRRGDWLTALLATVNRAIFWFHPLSWWLERKLSALSEEACDATAIANSGDALRYASVVLDFAGVMAAGRSRLSWEATAMARTSRVGGRIERILEGKMVWSRSFSRGGWLALGLLALPLVYSAAALQMQQPRVQSGGGTITAGVVPSGMPMPGALLTTEQAQALEGRVVANPDDLDARGQLLGYYFTNARTDAYVKEVFWLVEHHPESDIHRQFPMNYALSAGTVSDAATRDALVELWKRKAAENPASADVLLNAAHMVSGSQPADALEILKQASLRAPGDERIHQKILGMYAQAAMRTPSNLYSGPWGEFSAGLKRELATTTDARLVGELGRRLAAIRLPAREGMPESMFSMIRERSMQMHEAGLQYLDRAIQLEPGNEEWQRARMALSKLEVLEPPQAARLTVMSSQQPDYPPLARQARIAGEVKVAVRVSAEGRVESANAVEGHPLLRQAAEECVRSWTFSPQRIDGKAVASETQTVVHFTLPSSDGPSASGNGGVIPPKRITVASAVQKSLLVSAPDPVYPPLAAQARIQGTVRFQVIIGADGRVSNLTLVSGHPLIVQAAVEAVRQYVYKPTTLNGVPVEVVTEVDVRFTL